jgi:tetratricopeptide (TPR) repeat protein
LAGSAPGAAAQDDNNDNLAEGRQLSREGRYAEARVRLAAALRNAQRDSDTRSVAMILDCLGVNEEDSGDYRQAETYLNHGLSTIQPYSPYEPALIDLQTHLAELYMAEMRPEDAEPCSAVRWAPCGVPHRRTGFSWPGPRKTWPLQA